MYRSGRKYKGRLVFVLILQPVLTFPSIRGVVHYIRYDSYGFLFRTLGAFCTKFGITTPGFIIFSGKNPSLAFSVVFFSQKHACVHVLYSMYICLHVNLLTGSRREEEEGGPSRWLSLWA